MKTIINSGKSMLLLALILCIGSCDNEMPIGNYYTFTGNTVASFLEENESEFSTFLAILDKAGIIGEMKTYGDYTCFAPTNKAFEEFFAEKGWSSVEDLPKEKCDTIAWSHIINETYYTTDLVEGAFPSPNRLDRYLTYSCDSDVVSGDLYYLVNKTSRLIECNDSVQNGVVHIVDKVLEPSNKMLPDIMGDDPNISLFYQALLLTRMNDSIASYIDENYRVPGGDSTTTGVYYHTGQEWEYAIFPEKRYFKFTAFVEPNSVYNAAGIYNLDDLIAYAKKVYDRSYPDDAGLYDDDFTDRRNPLNRFVSYHLLEFYGNYNDWNVTNRDILEAGNYCARPYIDIEDYFETLLPHSIMRICTPTDVGGLYINRKGSQMKPSPDYPGCRVWTPSETTVDQNALNGVYHYLDDIMEYSYEVRNIVLNNRIRIDFSTMSPDFVNSGGRNRPGTQTCTGLLSAYTKWWDYSDETLLSIRNRHADFWCYEGDEVILQGIYDATIKLPPVPFDGTYEIRMDYCAMSSRGVVQMYFNGDPCDIPLDLRIDDGHPDFNSKIGRINDSELDNDPVAIMNNDKAMRNRGYMKGMASYKGTTSQVFRDQGNMLRYIITTQYMSADQDYYIRMRQVLDNNMAEMQGDCLEIVPKNIYAGETPEDIY